LSCSSKLWRQGLTELKQRGGGKRESGAFLLGKRNGERRAITGFTFYDDLDPHCLDTGIIVFDGAYYNQLWQRCREQGLEVLADVHTHPGQAQQSSSDRTHPMVPKAGHIALIVPHFARHVCHMSELGIYEYQGNHCWQDHSGRDANQFFYVGLWG
jgi:proteasome lid subunit RPN8/RPN11